jgi:hypothetical protein
VQDGKESGGLACMHVRIADVRWKETSRKRFSKSMMKSRSVIEL